MKIKTSELKDTVLDYATAVVLGGTKFHYDTVATYWITVDGKARALSRGWAKSFTPSTDWKHGGPIIEREAISICTQLTNKDWMAISFHGDINGFGPTPLIAAMRCFVASHLGDEVEIPEELV